MTEPSNMEVDIGIMRGIVRDMAEVDPNETISLLFALADQIGHSLGDPMVCPDLTAREIETATAAIVAAYERAKA